MHGQLGEDAAVSVAHAHHGLVDVESLLVKSAELESVHEVVVGALRVEVACPRSVGSERGYAVGQAFLHKVVAKVHVVVLAYGQRYIYRTRPSALGYHLKHHQVALVESVLSLERNDHLVGYGVGCHHHAALLHGLLVDGHVERVGRYHVGQVSASGESLYHIEVLLGESVVANPVLENVLQLKGIVAEQLLGLVRVSLVHLADAFFQLRLHLHILVGAGAIFKSTPRDGHRRRVVGRTAHLVDIPVGLQVGEVAHAGIGAHAFGLLVVPQGERVVVSVGEDNRVAFLLQRHEVVLSEVAAGVAAAAVVVVPRLRCHLYRYEQTDNADDCGDGCFVTLQSAIQLLNYGCHAHTAPYCEGVERTGVGVVALTGLHRGLVEVDHDGESGHEEQEEHHPELADAFVPLAE